jgi:hypothetical protein
MESAGFIAKQRDAFVRAKERAALLDHARSRLNDRPMIRTDAERRTIAHNIWDLLEEIEKGPRGITKARVMQAAKGSTREDSTKHLPRYALRPDPAGEARRAQTLTKNAKKYLEIARAAARLAGLDPDDVELRVLEGTHYLSDPPTDVVEHDQGQRALRLELLLQDVAERVIQKCDLAQLIARMDERNWELRDGSRSAPMIVGTRPTKGLWPLYESPASRGQPALPDDWLARYPRLHLGYVKVPGKAASRMGWAYGQVTFTDEDGIATVRELQLLRVQCVPVLRVDLVLGRSRFAGQSRVAITATWTVWIKPFEPILCRSRDGDEFELVSLGETLGELPGHALVPPFPGDEQERWLGHAWSVESEGLDWGAGVWRSDLVLLSDKSGFLWDAEITEAQIGKVEAPILRSGGAWAVPYVLGLATSAPILDEPRCYRHFDPHPNALGFWTDERADGTSYRDHPLVANGERLPPHFLEPARFLEPVNAPEGSLYAFIERWLRGELKGQPRLEDALEAEARAFVERMRATEAHARNVTLRAMYGDGASG